MGLDGNCSICADGYYMINSKCIPIPPTPMGIEDKCAYPMHKSVTNGKYSCDICPLDRPYAKYDPSQDDLTTCVARSECEYPQVRYFAELDQSFAICLGKSTRFDFKSNGVNVGNVSRAVSVLGGKRHVAEVSA